MTKGGGRFTTQRFGPCRLCGRMIYGRSSAVRHDGAYRHRSCVPGGGPGIRYHVDDRKGNDK